MLEVGNRSTLPAWNCFGRGVESITFLMSALFQCFMSRAGETASACLCGGLCQAMQQSLETILLHGVLRDDIDLVSATLEENQLAVDYVLRQPGGKTLTWLAARCGSINLLAWLLQKGADPNFVAANDLSTPLHAAAAGPEDSPNVWAFGCFHRQGLLMEWLVLLLDFRFERTLVPPPLQEPFVCELNVASFCLAESCLVNDPRASGGFGC
jgi:hypothetical protein